MAKEVRSRTSQPLSATARRARISAVVAFFRDAIAWGWPDMPSHPLLDHRDMPRLTARIPRYIPTDELARLMAAVAELSCPYQRAALLVARWSGARRGEICRLSVDCLDTYPDGTARLRIPASKTMEERVVPLHEEAAEALHKIIAERRSALERPLPDRRTAHKVQYLFLRRGRPMSAFPCSTMRCATHVGAPGWSMRMADPQLQHIGSGTRLVPSSPSAAPSCI